MTTVLETELSGMIRSAPVISASCNCRETLRVMFQHPESRCIIVCSEENEPLGLLMSDRFFLKATGRSGTDMIYKEPAARLMNRNPLIADIAASPEALRALALARPAPFRNDCIIVTGSDKFIGVIHTSDLLR